MRWLIPGCLLVLLAVPLGAEDRVLHGGRYFDTERGELVPNPGLVVRAGRLFAIGGEAVRAPDLEETTLSAQDVILPGLVDLHAHYNVLLFERRRDETRVQPVVYLANGVTTTFPAGEYDPGDMRELRRRIQAGDQPGPRLLSSGPYYGRSRPGWRHDISEDDLIRDIDLQVERGARGFKAKGIQAEALRILIERAHHHGLTVTAHLDSGFRGSVNPKDAILMGIDRIEHFLGGDALPASAPAYSSLEKLDAEDLRVDAVIDLYLRHGVVFNATMSAFGYFGTRAEGFDYWEDERSFFTPTVQAAVAERQRAVNEQFERIFRVKPNTVKRFFDAGGTITLGTDHFSTGEYLPGFGAHRELDLLVRAGIPAADAIRIGTINGARAIGWGDRTGSIEPGKLADLLVVRGDPLENIRATRTVHLVMKAGQLYRTRELLDSVRGRLGPGNPQEAGEW